MGSNRSNRSLASPCVKCVALLSAAALAAGPALVQGWGGSGGGGSSDGRSSSGGSSSDSSRSGSGGRAPTTPSTGGACPQPSLAPLSVSFNTQGCFSCHGQATAAIPARATPPPMAAEPAHPTCTDPNAICPQIAYVHHASPLGGTCTACHQVVPPSPANPAGVTVQTNCLACHRTNGAVSAASVSLPGHSVDTHRIVRDACGRCHPEPVPYIHASVALGSRGGGGSSFSSAYSSSHGWSGRSSSRGFSAPSTAGQTAACFFCHLNFPQVIAAGLQRGCAACSNCHGNR